MSEDTVQGARDLGGIQRVDEQTGVSDLPPAAASHETPELILKETLAPGLGLAPYQARKLAFGIGIPPGSMNSAVGAMMALAKAYLAMDASYLLGAGAAHLHH